MKSRNRYLIGVALAIIPVIVLVASHPAVGGCIPAPGGMVSWWPGDGNANDIIGPNNGTFLGGMGTGPGKVDQAFVFDGTDDAVDLGDVLDTGMGSFSIDLWFRTSIDSNTRSMKLISKGMTIAGTPTNAGYDLLLRNGLLHFRMIDGASTVYSATTAQPSLGAWHHVAGVLDRATNTGTLYLNGSPVNTVDTTGMGSLDTNIPLAIGALHRGAFGSTSEYFQGDIDEVEFFNIAISGTTVAALHTADSAGKCKGACCIGGGTPNTPAECIMSTQGECETAGNLYLGDGRLCDEPIDCYPLLVTFESLTAEATLDGVLLSWTTQVEIDTVGFRILRETPEKSALQVIAPMIPASGHGLAGASYEFLDNTKQSASAVHYFIEDIDIYGRVTRHGPIVVHRRDASTVKPGRQTLTKK